MDNRYPAEDGNKVCVKPKEQHGWRLNRVKQGGNKNIEVELN